MTFVKSANLYLEQILILKRRQVERLVPQLVVVLRVEGVLREVHGLLAVDGLAHDGSVCAKEAGGERVDDVQGRTHFSLHVIL
jgi:hypothetical protein